MAQNENLTDLPLGLPDHIYASWRGALGELRSSSTTAIGRERYQFCCGYLQALTDSQLVEAYVYAFLNAEIQEIWVETSTALAKRGG